MIKQGIQALAALMVFTASPATSAVVLQENFESGTFGIFQQSLTGSVSVATGNLYFGCCGTSGTPSNMANYFVAFGGGDQPSGSISLTTQFFAALGQAYALTFDYGALGPASGETLAFTIGANTQTLFPDSNNNLNTTFANYTYNFVGTGAMTQLSFMGGTFNSADAILDNVVISAVPELEVWAMMLFGFGAIGMQMRRRRSLRAVTA